MEEWAKAIQDYFVIPKPQRKPEVWKQGGNVEEQQILYVITFSSCM